VGFRKWIPVPTKLRTFIPRLHTSFKVFICWTNEDTFVCDNSPFLEIVLRISSQFKNSQQRKIFTSNAGSYHMDGIDVGLGLLAQDFNVCFLRA
jgi:hypothetical protein